MQASAPGAFVLGGAVVLAWLVAGCGDDAPAGPDAGVDASVDAGALDSGADAGASQCEGFVEPARPDTTACADPDPLVPDHLGACVVGSGHVGLWAVDADGLPAYDFTAEERCDPAARAWSPRRVPQRDPIHLLGNGRGLVAMAHASGGIEIYSQDRGHTWVNHVDTWADPRAPSYAPQLGGGFSYLALPDGVRSTRFEDNPVADATRSQTRRFGVGYAETVTRFGELTVRRRVLAPDADARALVAEVTLENRSSADATLGLVELWDPNLHEIVVELATSDLLAPGVTEAIDRRRRDLARQFTQTARWDAATRVAVLETRAKALPAGIDDRADVSDVDWFPDPLFLATLDADALPDAVWLRDDELWDGTDRSPPSRASASLPSGAATRSLALDGEGQHALLALRVPVSIPAGGRVTRRFAFGYVPGGGAPDAAVAELRARAGTIASETSASWHDRLVWASFPGLARAGAMQRELAWAAYNVLANTTFDEYRGVRVMGQGGSYKYVHGLDGAMGDLAIFADALVLLDPALARDTLAYTLASQHAGSDVTPWRYPYATTGVGSFNDVGIYDQRSDAYYLVPSAVGRYVATTRDTSLLDLVVPFWPRAAGESATVLEHLDRGLDYATGTLGIGARGLVAMGTGDYADGIASLATEPATPTGTSSTYDAGFVVTGFPLAAAVVRSRDAALADRMSALATSQATALSTQAWEGRWFYRGFVDSGNPLAPELLFLEPQLFPILAGLVDSARRDVLLDAITTYLETPIGAASTVPVDATGPVGGVDRPQIAGIWPVANAWLTEAYSMRDATEAWSSFTRNTLATHADAYPDIWYGIWTGPDSFNGPGAARPGEADAHLATALTDYPALNAHAHTSPLRALAGILGIAGTADGLRVVPRVPTETFSVVFPRLALQSRPDAISGSVTASATGPLRMHVALPSGLRTGAVAVRVAGAPVAGASVGGAVEFTLDAIAGEAVPWSVAVP